MLFQKIKKVLPSCLIDLLLTVLCVPGSVLGDSMRCGQRVVRTGDSPAALLDRCGEPRHRDTAYARVKTGDGLQKVRVEQWFYKSGARSLERIVMIYKGDIVRIETGRR